jgi:hypothetical protein
LGNWTIGRFGHLSKTCPKLVQNQNLFFIGQVLDRSHDKKFNLGQNYD